MFLTTVQQEKSSLADLQTLVSMPVNRISQYEHHLQVLADTEIEGTPAHADYVQAFSVLSQSSTVVQKSLVQSAETAKLFNCQRRLKSEKPLSLLKPGRKAISEVKFKKHTLMLFNDLVIVAKSAEQKTFRATSHRAKSGKADKKKHFGEGLRVKAIAEMDKVHIKETGDSTPPTLYDRLLSRYLLLSLSLSSLSPSLFPPFPFFLSVVLLSLFILSLSLLVSLGLPFN